jgi:hypothetical protein
MRRLSLFMAFLAILGDHAQASGQAPAVESFGETSAVMSCFYECKPGPTVGGQATWREVTSLMLVNQGNFELVVTLVFLNARQDILAQSDVSLSSGYRPASGRAHRGIRAPARPVGAPLCRPRAVAEHSPDLSDRKAWRRLPAPGRATRATRLGCSGRSSATRSGSRRRDRRSRVELVVRRLRVASTGDES